MKVWWDAEALSPLLTVQTEGLSTRNSWSSSIHPQHVRSRWGTFTDISVMTLWPLLETLASSKLHWSLHIYKFLDIIQSGALAGVSSTLSCICVWLRLLSLCHLFMSSSVGSPSCCPWLVEAVFWCAESLWGSSSCSPAQPAALALTCSKCSFWLRRWEQTSRQEPRTSWTWCTSSRRWDYRSSAFF